MDGGGTLYSIGELAGRTGLTVKAIRFYSEHGIVVPAMRSQAGYRLYGIEAVARLELVRTLRDLGVDLQTVRKVVHRELSLCEVAEVHAQALTVQIHTLFLRRAVLAAVARRNATPEEMNLMHQLAKLSERQRLLLIDDFLKASFGGVGADMAFEGIGRSMTPVLPDNPSSEQMEAWIELAELSEDPDFRALVRQLAEAHAAERAVGPTRPHPDIGAITRDVVGPALESGVEPTSPEAVPMVGTLAVHYAPLADGLDNDELLRRLLVHLSAVADPRRERYLQLLAVINGWPPPESLAPMLGWSIEALEAQLQ
ncbi:MAG TPA: MerR family transcriptional regulator [Streptosporangiaceae bacterium]